MRSQEELRDLLVRLRRVYSYMTNLSAGEQQRTIESGFDQEQIRQVILSVVVFMDVLDYVLEDYEVNKSLNPQINPILTVALPTIENHLKSIGRMRD